MRDDDAGDAMKKPESIEELNLFSTEDLLSELFSRYDNAVFIGSVPHTMEHDELNRRWYGDAIKCIGLASYMQKFICDYFEDGEIDDDD